MPERSEPWLRKCAMRGSPANKVAAERVLTEWEWPLSARSTEASWLRSRDAL